VLFALLGSALAGDSHVYWGSIHEHSGLTREAYGFSADDVYRYMLTESELDFGAVTDHDWAMAHGTWWQAKAAVNAFHCPSGATGCYAGVEDAEGLPERPFVTLLGYEWGNNAWPTADDPARSEYGHRNVWFLDGADPEGAYGYSEDTGAACEVADGCIPMIPSGQDLRSDSWNSWYDPCHLWEGLAGLLADDPDLRLFTAGHHVALSISGYEGSAEFGREKPPAMNWEFHPDLCEGVPEGIEPLVEVYSVWGSNERADMPPEEDPVDGLADDDKVIREVALGGAAGRRHYLGFYGSGDNHAGNAGHDPGHSWLERPAGDFLSYKSDCNPDAECGVRFGRTGLVGVLVPAEGERDEDLTREAIFDGLQARRTIATTGERFHLTFDVRVGDGTGGQGQDLRALNLGGVDDAALSIDVDLGAYSIARLQVVVGGEDDWSEVDVDEALGLSAWSGEVALVTDGRPRDWLPEGEVVLYVRVAAEAIEAMEVPEGGLSVTVTESSGGSASIAVPAGRYSGAALGEAFQGALNAAEGLELGYSITFHEDSAPRFEISMDGTSEGASFGFAEAAEFGYLMGFRDDVDTPEKGFCNPCESAISVDGGEVRERAWASPVWLTNGDHVDDPDTAGDTAGDSGDGGKTCGCAAAGAGGVWWLLVATAWWRRR